MTLKEIEEKIEQAKKHIGDLKVERRETLFQEMRQRRKDAKFRCGDIVKYNRKEYHTNYQMRGAPTIIHHVELFLLIAQVSFHSDGAPRYGGLQILKGKVKRVWCNTTFEQHPEVMRVGTVENIRIDLPK